MDHEAFKSRIESVISDPVHLLAFMVAIHRFFHHLATWANHIG